jgi:6-phosphofructokinase 1
MARHEIVVVDYHKGNLLSVARSVSAVGGDARISDDPQTIRDAAGVPVAAKFAAGEKDSHGNLQLSGTGALGDFLAAHLKANAGIARVRADTFGYLQRSFPGIAGETDRREAFAAGAAAVKAALKGVLAKGTIAVVRENSAVYRVAFAPVPIAEAAKYTRPLPKEYIARNGHDVTAKFIEYVKPIVGPLPKCEIF